MRFSTHYCIKAEDGENYALAFEISITYKIPMPKRSSNALRIP